MNTCVFGVSWRYFVHFVRLAWSRYLLCKCDCLYWVSHIGYEVYLKQKTFGLGVILGVWEFILAVNKNQNFGHIYTQ